MITKDQELAGLAVLQELATEGTPAKYARLAMIALGVVEDLITRETTEPELVLEAMRASVRDEWAVRIRQKFSRDE